MTTLNYTNEVTLFQVVKLSAAPPAQGGTAYSPLPTRAARTTDVPPIQMTGQSSEMIILFF